MIERVFRGIPRPFWLVLAALLPYLPFLSLPAISDTYTQIFLARQYGPPAGWADLAADPLYRCRATSLVLTWLVDSVSGSATTHKAASLFVHIANVLLVYALGRWRLIGYRLSFPAAFFFALYEGHQEAIVWVAALPELLMFFFSLATLHAWIRWSESGFEGVRWLFAATAAFVLALLSKESAVAIVPVLGWVAWRERGGRTAWVALGTYSILCSLYAGLIFAASRQHLHLNDGTFSLSAPVWFTLPNTVTRMLWVWGLAGIAALVGWRTHRHWARTLEFSGVWIVCTLAPYCFLLYMNRVPSRHTYFASAGLAMIVGMGFVTARNHWRGRWVAHAMLATVALHNCGYLWAKKLHQYEARASVTERFIEYARHHDGLIRIGCVGPYPLDVFRHAAAVALGRTPESVVQALEPGDEVLAVEAFCDDVHP